jgi:hypothetical protein
VVVRESHGANHPNAHGVHIYFPRLRMIDDLAAFDGHDEPYDLPSSRTFDGSTPRAHYGVLADQLPLKSRDPETGNDFDAFTAWPLPQSPGFTFPNDTGWRKVLDRYYHPTADNHILPLLINGVLTQATESGGGACANPSDSISVPVGTTVVFSGNGSADADQKAGVNPTYYFWDKDDKVGCLGGCIAPFTVPPGADAGAAANNNMDADQDIINTWFDQKDGAGPRFSRTCEAPGTFAVTLMTWDDDHLLPFHNTLPNADYVHPQTARHQATVNCTAPTTPAAFCPNSGMLNLTFTVTSDPFVSAVFVALSQGTLTMTRSGMGSQVSGTGDRAQLVPAQGPFDAMRCAFTLKGTSTGPVAGFPNVQSQYDLTIGGPKFDTVTGTYQVGLQNTLNNEPQPVTYKVTGTVTNAK